MNIKRKPSLEQRIEKLEEQAHTQHTFSLDPSAIDQIAELVLQKIIQRLSPPEPIEAKEE